MRDAPAARFLGTPIKFFVMNFIIVNGNITHV